MKRNKGVPIRSRSYHDGSGLDVKYILYLQKEQNKAKMKLSHAVKRLFNDIEYNDMKYPNNAQGVNREIISTHRRKIGLLRRSQLDIINYYDRNIVNGLQL